MNNLYTAERKGRHSTNETGVGMETSGNKRNCFVVLAQERRSVNVFVFLKSRNGSIQMSFPC